MMLFLLLIQRLVARRRRVAPRPGIWRPGVETPLFFTPA